MVRVMSKKLSVVFMPHPPIIVPEVGLGQEISSQKTIKAMHEMAKMIATLQPSTIIFTTPHGNSFHNGTCILDKEILRGDFSNYGASEVKFEKKVNRELSKQINCEFDRNGYVSILMNDSEAKRYGAKAELENGAMVAMYFIDQYYRDYNIVHITPGFTDLKENYALGALMRNVTKKQDKSVLLICSGDLSHALKSSGPYKYHPSGPVFDKLVKDAIETKDPLSLISLDENFIEEAAQCGLRSFLIGFVFLDGRGYKSEVISYEGPYGVGYLIGYLEEDREFLNASLLKKIEDLKSIKYNQIIQREDDYIKLARKSIEYFVLHRRKLDFQQVKEEFSKGFVEEAINKRAGVFVSIHKGGALRGCIGTIEPLQHNIIGEIIYNAISACSQDPRFFPVEDYELSELEISVDILEEPERIDSKEQLDVKRYGVIVEKGHRRGLLLPNLEGINNVEEQVKIAMEKAGIEEDEGVELFRFEVIRHEV